MNDAMVYICKNCIPDVASLPSQWNHAGTLVRLKLMPCSGKIDAQYMFHALEGGARGICIITCPEGKCKLSQGNYRAQVRTATVQRLLREMGGNPENVRLIQCVENETAERVKGLIDEFVGNLTPTPAVN